MYSTKPNKANIVINRLTKTIQGTQNSYAFLPCATTLVSFSFGPDPLLESVQSFAFYNCSALTKADFSSCTHLTFIGESAFRYCKACTILLLPEGITTIQTYAFGSCGIQNVTLPDSVLSIPQYCFDWCTKLVTLEITSKSQLKSINRKCLTNTLVKSLFIPSLVNSIDPSSFESSSLTEIILSPDNNNFYIQNDLLISSQKHLISRPPGLIVDTLDIPDGILSIDSSSCFQAKVKHISFPSSLIIINQFAFCGSQIIDLYIPDSVTSIGPFAFSSCSSLKTVKLSNNLTALQKACFQETKISEIVVPSSVKTVETYCFMNCPNLLKIVLPESVKMLGGSICSPSTKLTFAENSTLYIDDQMLIIDKKNTTIMSFIGPDSTTSISVLPTIETINENAFKDRAELLKIQFSSDSSLTTINNGCFSNCPKLQFINLPSSIEQVGNNAFIGCKKLDRFTSSSLKSLGENCFSGCSSLSVLDIKDSPLYILSVYCFDSCISLVTVELPHQLTNINDYCFADCIKLNSVIFPDSLSLIGEKSFYNCALTIADLYSCSQLKKIPDYAFSNNQNLNKIILPQNLESINVESFSFTKITNFTTPLRLSFIGNSAFKGCKDLITIRIERDSLISSFGVGIFKDCVSISKIECESENFVVDNGALFSSDRSTLILYPPAAPIKYFYMPATTKTITEYAFMNCVNLHTVLIPSDSITRIDNSAFQGCRSLQIINIPISVTFVGIDAFAGCPNLRCGLAIENRTASFLNSLVIDGKLNKMCLRDCTGVMTQNCYSVYGYISILYTTPLIILC